MKHKHLSFVIVVIILLNIILPIIGYADGTTYDALVFIDDPILARMKDGGATDEEIKAYMDDIDEFIGNFKDDIPIDDIDAYFIMIMLQVMQEEEHISILIAFDGKFQDEIAYILEKKKIPKTLQDFMYASFHDKLSVIVRPIPTESVEPIETIKPSPTPAPTVLPFSDIESVGWAIPSIVNLYELGVTKGIGDGKFGPDLPVLREEFLKMIVLTFLDVNELYYTDENKKFADKWYYPYLASAQYYSLISSIYDDEFSENMPITRQEMCAIAYRASRRTGIELPNVHYALDFYDMNQFKYYAVDAIKELQEADIIHGMGNNFFEPNGTTTRAEASKIIYSIYKLKK